jgi:hypothetical protein
VKPILNKTRFAREVLFLLLAIAIGPLTATVMFADEKTPDQFLFPRPPLSEEMSPCSKCHDNLAVNKNKRALEENHKNIFLEHMSQERWCLDCHSSQKIDMLTLANGELLDFNDSYKLCLQCHGAKKRDWEMGVHGRRTGEWNGIKIIRRCAQCHDAHQPQFEALEAFPPPQRPSEING